VWSPPGPDGPTSELQEALNVARGTGRRDDGDPAGGCTPLPLRDLPMPASPTTSSILVSPSSAACRRDSSRSRPTKRTDAATETSSPAHAPGINANPPGRSDHGGESTTILACAKSHAQEIPEAWPHSASAGDRKEIAGKSQELAWPHRRRGTTVATGGRLAGTGIPGWGAPESRGSDARCE